MKQCLLGNNFGVLLKGKRGSSSIYQLFLLLAAGN